METSSPSRRKHYSPLVALSLGTALAVCLSCLYAGMAEAQSPPSTSPEQEATSTELAPQAVVTQLEAESWPVEIHFEVLVPSPLLVIATNALDPASALQVWQAALDRRGATALVPVIVPNRADGAWTTMWAGFQQTWSLEGGFDRVAPADPAAHDSVFAELEARHRQAESQVHAEIEAARAGHPTHPMWEQWVRQCDSDPTMDCHGPSIDELRTSLDQCPDALLQAEPRENEMPESFGFIRLAELHQDLNPGSTLAWGFRVLLLACEPSLIPRYLGFGGFNECPTPEEHGRAFAEWDRSYGIHLVFIGPDTMEYWVRRPPTEPAQVRELAWQQFVYCRDIVFQGTGSLPLLARELAGNAQWFFWWD